MSRLERAPGQQPEQLPTDGLTPEQDQQLADLVSRWRGGRISIPVFTELARMIPQSIVEVVLFRRTNGILETLLIPRPKDDIVWPGMYHTPGTALRASDFHREDQNPLNGAFERLQSGELNSAFSSAPAFVGRLHRVGDRGPEVVEVYIAELFEASTSQLNHVWYPVDQLASNPNFMQSLHEHVIIAAELYNKRTGEVFGTNSD